MPGIQNGAELVKRLKESGTGESKLAIARKVLADTYKFERRTATSDEILLALESAGVSESTITKARSLAETGSVPAAIEAAQQQRPIEDILLGGSPTDLSPDGDNPPPDWTETAPPKLPPGSDSPEYVGPRKVPQKK